MWTMEIHFTVVPFFWRKSEHLTAHYSSLLFSICLREWIFAFPFLPLPFVPRRKGFCFLLVMSPSFWFRQKKRQQKTWRKQRRAEREILLSSRWAAARKRALEMVIYGNGEERAAKSRKQKEEEEIATHISLWFNEPWWSIQEEPPRMISCGAIIVRRV